MYYIPEPATRMECDHPDCLWSESYFFDQVPPDRCPRCRHEHVTRQVLTFTTLYSSNDQRRAV